MKFSKATTVLFLLLISATGTLAQKTVVSANIADLKDPSVVIYYAVGDTTRADTVKVENGKFTWRVSLPEPQKVMIFFPRRMVDFFAEAGRIQITGTADSLHKLTVIGSKTQDEADAYEASLKDISDQERALYSKWGKGTDAEQAALEAKLGELRFQRRARAEKYIASHPKSAVSVHLVWDRAAMGTYEDVKTVFNQLHPSAQSTTIGKQIAARLEILKRSRNGETILDFTQNNKEGQPVRFADFKGKYVFVDFWASWCGPCRAENPNVLKAYNTYKDRNFTVVGISLDDNGDKWRKAIIDDGMPWTQLSDLKGWKNEVSTYYGIRGIPSSLLVDPQGKIIAKDLRGAELHQKLEELFGK